MTNETNKWCLPFLIVAITSCSEPANDLATPGTVPDAGGDAGAGGVDAGSLERESLRGRYVVLGGDGGLRASGETTAGIGLHGYIFYPADGGMTLSIQGGFTSCCRSYANVSLGHPGAVDAGDTVWLDGGWSVTYFQITSNPRPEYGGAGSSALARLEVLDDGYFNFVIAGDHVGDAGERFLFEMTGTGRR